MTGTAMTEANEFWKIYKLDVIAIPTNRPLTPRRTTPTSSTAPSRRSGTRSSRRSCEIHKTGRPILIGTTDVEKSREALATCSSGAASSTRCSTPSRSTSARPRSSPRPAGIGAVTIATNMAGRGTDIILGGNPETHGLGRPQATQYDDAGSTYPTRLEVPTTSGRDRSRKTRQDEGRGPRGRRAGRPAHHRHRAAREPAASTTSSAAAPAGRATPARSRFFLSLEDDLMRHLRRRVGRRTCSPGSAWRKARRSRAGWSRRRIEAAQKKVEERNFDIRKNLLEYDEVMDDQRKRVYGFRQRDPRRQPTARTLILEHDRRADRAGRRPLPGRRLRRRRASPSSPPSGWASSSTPADFARSRFDEAEKTARDKASRSRSRRSVQEAMDENLGARGRQGVELAGAGPPGQHPLRAEDHRPAAQADRQGQPAPST